jgi:DNA-binding NtrC family response regulator
MRLNVFSLENMDTKRVEAWCQELTRHRKIELKHFEPESASSALWRGDPFLVAGSKHDIELWLTSLDEVAREVLSNSGYYWLLTDNARFHHALLPFDRVAVLDWRADEQQVVGSAISQLEQFPRLAGLSNDARHLREEILRLSTELRGPSTPVLILGESGSGKEEVAQSLVAMSGLPAKPGLRCLSGAWLKLDPGMAHTELLGIDRGIATGVAARAGLFETHSTGALFIDDFDTAPQLVQEQLLRITATEKGKPATFRRLGGLKDIETSVWLIFATNADIEGMLNEKQLRPDFLYRFEDRVLLIPPLRDRLADLPAIAYHIWSRLILEAQDQEKATAHQKEAPDLSVDGRAKVAIEDRVLSWKSIKDIYSRKLQWEGNVRELAALLRLVASMARMPQHREHSTGALLEHILARGVNSKQWFIRTARSGILTSAPTSKKVRPVDEVLTYDSGPMTGELSPCEASIREALGESWARLREIAEANARTDLEQIMRNFCRYLYFAKRFGSINVADAGALTKLGPTQAGKHLKWLAQDLGVLKPAMREKPNSKLSYQLGTRFARFEAAEKSK